MADYHLITNQELKKGYFFVTHRILLKKIGLALFALVVISIYFQLIFTTVSFIQTENFKTSALQIDQSQDWLAYHRQHSPAIINVSAVQYLPLGGKRYNLVAFVSNPNENWAVSGLEYNFVVNHQPLDSEVTFLNPGERRMIIKMGYQSDQAITDLEVEVGNLKWRRFSNDTAVVNWDIKDVVFTPVSNQVAGEDIITVPARVEWTAQNLSLYNFWEVGWQAAIFSGDKLVGVNQISVENWPALETKNLSAVWLSDLSRVTKTEVYPVLNWLDTDNFKVLYPDGGGNERVNL